MQIATIVNAVNSTTNADEARELVDLLAPAFSEALDDIPDDDIRVFPLMKIHDGMWAEIDVTIACVGCVTVHYGIPASVRAPCLRMAGGFHAGWAKLWPAEDWTANLAPNIAALVRETQDDVLLRLQDIVAKVADKMLVNPAA